MTQKLERESLVAEVATLEQLLNDLTPEDWLDRRSLQARRERVLADLEKVEKRFEPTARIALFFGGKPVVGTHGIDTGFTANTLGAFQKLITKVAAESSDDGTGGGRESSRLHITECLHGSFGFQFEELADNSPAASTSLKKASELTARLIIAAGESDEVFAEAIAENGEKVAASLKDFFSELDKEKATFRMVTGAFEASFNSDRVRRARERTEDLNVRDETVKIAGEFLGVCLGSRRFEMKAGEQVIRCTVGPEFSREYLIDLNTKTGKQILTAFKKTIIESAGKKRERFSLEKIET